MIVSTESVSIGVWQRNPKSASADFTYIYYFDGFLAESAPVAVFVI